MRNFFLLLLLTYSNYTFAQTEPVTNQFQSFYNAEKYDSIFALFSAETKTALPLNNISTFLKNMHAQFGTITKRQLVKSEGNTATYKTIFEKANFLWNIAIDNKAAILGFTFVPDKNARNITRLQLPFKGEWDVIWGGDTKELNYHVQSEAQKNAFDILIKDNTGKSFKTDGKHNEDYYAFGKELIAPCDGEVVMAVDGIKDNVPGIMNPIYLVGNSVIIRTVNNEYLLFAHFKNHSIKVQEGQKVKQGQLLGLCGNSGNSSEPHLHFHIQSAEDMNVSTGIKCYFDKLVVNGETKTDYSPIQKDKIKN